MTPRIGEGRPPCYPRGMTDRIDVWTDAPRPAARKGRAVARWVAAGVLLALGIAALRPGTPRPAQQWEVARICAGYGVDAKSCEARIWAMPDDERQRLVEAARRDMPDLR